MYRFESLSLRQETLNISKMHRNVRLTKPDVFLFPAPLTPQPLRLPFPSSPPSPAGQTGKNAGKCLE